MPRIKRWFPVSQEINRDAQIWELCRLYGDRALRIWLELLSIADRNDGSIPGASAELPPDLRRALADASRTTGRTVAEVWRTIGEWSWVNPSTTPMIAKYWKYHVARETKEIPRGKPDVSPPNLSEPSEPIIKDTDTSKSPPKPELSIQDFCDSWNEYFKGKLPAVRLPLAVSRERKLRARLRDHPELQFWKDVFGKVWTSDFLMGRNGNSSGHWKASFDWLIANDTNILKIAEGNYVNKDR